MSEYRIVPTEWGSYVLHIKDAKLRFKNFSGRETDKNRAGNRNVCVNIDDPEIYQQLLDDGWRFRTDRVVPGDENSPFAEPFSELPNGKVAIPYTQCIINYHSDRPPVVTIHTSRNKAGYVTDEAHIGELDATYLQNVKLSINPHAWKSAVFGEGTKGYINVMHVTKDDDPFADDEEYQDDEMPY